MFKQFILVFLFVVAGSKTNPVFSQGVTESQHLVDHKPLMNEVWKTFDTMLYKVNKVNGKTVYTPYFPIKLSKLDGTSVELQGYMVPLKAGLRHNRFLLSVLPVQQCMFCGQNGIPPMVEVTLSDNNKVWLKENPVIVKGYVKLNEKDRSRVEIFIRDAALLKQ